LDKSSASLNTLFQQLKQTPDGALFNPWYDRDEEHDKSEDAFKIRREQLRTYLQERLDSAQYLFIAEALGYQGGHFSGIAMTSERILLGHHRKKNNIAPGDVFQNLEPQRTSKTSVIEKGFTEPTATIMWKALINRKLNPYHAVLWNALCWHPYNPEKGLLSNRTPTDVEMKAGEEVLNTFLELFPERKIIAVGRKAEGALDKMGVDYHGFRHPANGGAPKFRRQLKELMT